jgi:transitional endoplasmic reticulum ATPase
MRIRNLGNIALITTFFLNSTYIAGEMSGWDVVKTLALGAFATNQLMSAYYTFYTIKTSEESKNELKKTNEKIGNTKGSTFRFNTILANNPDLTDLEKFFGEKVPQDIKNLLNILSHPERLNKLGGKLPKGIILSIPSGTDASLLARILALAYGGFCMFISRQQVKELVVTKEAAVWRGILREVHANANEKGVIKKPLILFIDGIDALAGRNQVELFTTFLTEMDALDEVIVIGTTTKTPDIFDAEVKQPGRFDHFVKIDLPDCKSRAWIIDMHIKGINGRKCPLADDVYIDNLASRTEGFASGDLEILIKAAAEKASYRGAETVSKQDFDDSLSEMLERRLLRSKEGTAREGSKQISERLDITPTTPNATALEDFFGGKVPQEIKNLLGILSHPEKFKNLGGKLPKGIILSGPPGTGKTTLGRALAAACDGSIMFVSGDQFNRPFVGQAGIMMHNFFKQAREFKKDSTKPLIVFIDELDALTKKRYDGSHTGDHSASALTALLNEMDTVEGIIVIGATNMPNVIDPAIKRPGRFDHIIEIGLPDCESRKSILKLHINKRKCPLNSEVNIADLASRTEGLSGADLEALINFSIMKAGGRGVDTLGKQDFDDSLNDVLARRSLETKNYIHTYNGKSQ